jgi:ABC-type branched-subunit amino acid transport system substrate-binding protein
MELALRFSTAPIEKAGDRIVASEDFPVNETDFRAILKRVRQRKPDAWYLNTAAPASYQRLFLQLRELSPDSAV